MVVNTRTRQRGWCWRLLCSATETAPARCFACSIPSITRGRVPTCRDTRSSPTSWREMSIPNRPHVGRGGWTWYTGSAGWLYRVGLEAILGFRLRGRMLSIDPCVPRNWPNFSITFRYHSAVYKIRVENPSSVTRGVALMNIDGKLVVGLTDIALTDDGAEHKILVVMG